MTFSKNKSRNTARGVIISVNRHASEDRAKKNEWFFKTGKGEYGEGDSFIGVSTPLIRKIARDFNTIPFKQVRVLLRSKTHELRLTALFILVYKYANASKSERTEVVKFYLKNISHINNWDLVDCSAPQILGQNYLINGQEKKLYKLAQSKNLWERRIAIVSTLAFIRVSKLKHTVKISKILLRDKHDLIHKAVGWMLREVGKKDKTTLIQFLKQHAHEMPRTMLRYSIEHFNKTERAKWLSAKTKKLNRRTLTR